MSDTIRLAHGFGGKLSQDLLDTVIIPALSETPGHAPTLDAAVIEDLTSPVVVSTDSFTVSPLFFPGGDIGKLAVCGTVNDIVMMGALPQYLSLALIIEEGLPLAELCTIMGSVGATCRAAGVTVVTGDTKVVERGVIDGIFINTTGFGSRLYGPYGPSLICLGDDILITGTIGDHGAAILNAREKLGFGSLASDCALLNELLAAASNVAGPSLHALRDPTRGGIAATLNEFAIDTGYELLIRENDIPIRPEVLSFLDVLGLDALTLANEGKALLFVSQDKTYDVLSALKAHPLGRASSIIGRVECARERGRVVMETTIGTRRIIEMPLEAGLPRIC
jgi:hydrogenase expression/formation protein HypE